MDITEVRIKLMEDPQERLQAFCSITFDHCFVIRDLKIIEGAKGSFVAMPSRKLTDRCPRCNTKNQLRALYCNQCGVQLLDNRAGKDADGRAKLYADIAHPINSRCRELIQKKDCSKCQRNPPPAGFGPRSGVSERQYDAERQREDPPRAICGFC